MATTGTSTGLRFKNILLPLDFSPRSNSASQLAAAIARQHGSTVHLANVIETFDPSGMSDRARRETEHDHALSDFGSVESKYFSGVKHNRLLVDGDVGTSLLHSVRDRQIDLVVMATHGAEGCERLLFGSVTEEVFRSVECPVLAVGPYVTRDYERFASFHKILYPMEVTPSSIAAVPYVVGLMHERGSQVTLLHIVHPDVQSPSERECIRERLTSEMTELFPTSTRTGLEDVTVVFGSVADTIVEFATARRADVIVLGVRHAGAFTRGATHIPWTIAHKIIALAPCPVLTVRHTEARSQ